MFMSPPSENPEQQRCAWQGYTEEKNPTAVQKESLLSLYSLIQIM